MNSGSSYFDHKIIHDPQNVEICKAVKEAGSGLDKNVIIS